MDEIEKIYNEMKGIAFLDARSYSFASDKTIADWSITLYLYEFFPATKKLLKCVCNLLDDSTDPEVSYKYLLGWCYNEYRYNLLSNKKYFERNMTYLYDRYKRRCS